MIKIYNVYERHKLIGQVRAFSERDACEQVYMKRGSASRYTGNSMKHYKAQRVGL